MIHTLMQIFVFQALLLAIYDLFIRKETFFTLNRIYLLIAPVLGFILPFTSIGFIGQNLPQDHLLQLPTVLVENNISEGSTTGNIFWLPILMNVWFIGVGIFLTIFSLKIYKILKLKVSGNTEKFQGYKVITLSVNNTAFSFFDAIYLGKNISGEKKNAVIEHEKIHILQKHTLDLLLFELLRIIFWFNPIIYLFQNRITTLHEFIADAKVISQIDKKQYYENLLYEVFQTEKISFINTFFNQSLIKKRISMLQRSRSKKIARLKYLLAFPVICAMLVYSSCSNESKENHHVDGTNQKVVSIEEMDGNEADKTSLDVPFAVIEKTPVFPGCLGDDNETLKMCMSYNISMFVNENFNTELGKKLELSERQRIAVQFKIDASGNVVDVRARAQKPELEEEAIRVIKMLPKMQPGEQKGEKVGVLYSLPIVFDVQ